MPHAAQLAQVLVFVGLVAGVYVAAGGLLIRWLWRRGTGRPAPKLPAWRRRVHGGVLILAAGGLVCMAYGRFIEPTWLEVTRTELEMKDLPAGAAPIRIVHLTDTHCERSALLEPHLPDVVAKEQPDLVVFTGDAVTGRGGLERFRWLMKEVARIAPTYAVGGNWDAGRDPASLYAETGVVVLEDASAEIELAGRTIHLLGLSAGRELTISPDRLKALADEDLVIALHHYPGAADRLPPNTVDLCLAGHTHGGQVALPLLGPPITLSDYASGLYRVDDRWLYVSRGLGLEGGRAPRVRFCARPEVAVITLRPSSTPRGDRGRRAGAGLP
jgi:hypothetical protein